MRDRWGLGPVFALEWLTISRRWQVYAGRMLFVGLLLVGLSCVWLAQVAGRPMTTIAEQAAVGRFFFYAIGDTQFILILIVAPAATAGAICQDKERGNLLPMLLTDLTDAEIVLGKLACRLVPLLGMVGCSLPVLAVGSLLGGIDPAAMSGALAVGVAMAVLVCSIALAFSTWGTRTHEVVLATMAVEAIWLLSVPIWWFFSHLWHWPEPPRWALAAAPFDLAWGPYNRPDKVGWVDYVGFCGVALAIAAGLIALAVARMRSVAVAGMDGPRAQRKATGVGDRTARLDRDPAGWYERHRRRPTPWMRNMIRGYFAFAVGFGLLAVVDGFWPAGVIFGWFPAYVVAFSVAFGLPLVLLAAATSTVEERARGSLDVLLATPMSTRRIVLAKWWAAFRHVGMLLPIPTLIVIPLDWASGRWWMALLVPVSIVAWAASAASVGLALATWVKRPARAVALAVALYTLVALGWPMLVMGLTGGPYNPTCWVLSAVSPFYGGFYNTIDTATANYYPRVTGPACLGWAMIHAMTAAALLLATLATFDRALGRMSERSRPPASRDPIKRTIRDGRSLLGFARRSTAAGSTPT